MPNERGVFSLASRRLARRSLCRLLVHFWVNQRGPNTKDLAICTLLPPRGHPGLVSQTDLAVALKVLGKLGFKAGNSSVLQA
jgi:hypothetical protein